MTPSSLNLSLIGWGSRSPFLHSLKNSSASPSSGYVKTFIAFYSPSTHSFLCTIAILVLLREPGTDNVYCLIPLFLFLNWRSFILYIESLKKLSSSSTTWKNKLLNNCNKTPQVTSARASVIWPKRAWGCLWLVGREPVDRATFLSVLCH